MERFELDDSLKDEIRSRVLGDGFMKLVQSVRRNGSSFRISLRPVEIGGVRRFQAEMTDDGRVQVRNFDAPEAAKGLEEIMGQKGARDLHLMTATGDLHVRVTKKGRALVSRSAQMDRAVVVQPHDRVKNLPLTSFDSAALLRVTGLADGEGRIRASMRGKYDQVNEFLKIVGDALGPARGESGSSRVDLESSRVSLGSDRVKETLKDATATLKDPNSTLSDPNLTLKDPKKTLSDPKSTLTVVDCGCGKAYLTLALYLYLTRALGYPCVRVIGVDRRADVIESARRMAERLDVADGVSFVESDLASFSPEGGRADLVVSLHACDTATDEAIAKGVEWKARHILSAPCCQHELQKSLAELGGRAEGPAADFGGLLRQSILRERLCDILTDAFRAMILRILGFRTQVVEFVSSEATARNILLKAEWGVKPGQGGPVGEYLALRDYWRVTPWLETRLSPILRRHLDRYES